MKVFLLHESCKTIFRSHNRCDNDTDRDGLCATVRFLWLNFSSESTLYQTYFPNYFRISAAIISAIFPIIFTHIQLRLKTTTKIYIFYSQHNQLTLCRHTFWHLVICNTLLYWVISLFSLGFVCRGTYDIYVEIDGQPKLVGNYDNAGFFGELALMYNMPRAATIIASSPGTIWALVSKR